MFYNINKTTCKLYVPVGSKSLYQAAVRWKDFTNLLETATEVEKPFEYGKNVSILINPDANSFRILGLNTDFYITLIDLNGRELYSNRVNYTDNIYIRGLSKGLYIVKIGVNDSTFERKLLLK